MNIERKWAMPNSNTFSIKPINDFIYKHMSDGIWLDPFSRNSPFAHRCTTNDLCEDFSADFHEDALDFLKRFDDNSVDGILFDPPYSPRQISECYAGVGKKAHMTDTQSSFYTLRKKECRRILKTGGKFICFGWNSMGIGDKTKFKMTDVLLVPHGGARNDTICTVEIKI